MNPPTPPAVPPRPATPRLVATDLDGTVVRPDGTMSARTVAALQAVEAAGATLVFVTGRPPRWLPEIAAATGHTGLAVCANGALVYDLRAERVVERHPLAVEAALSVVRALRRAVPGVGFAVEDEGGFGHEPTYQSRGDAAGHRVGTIEDLLAAPVAKLLVRHESRDSDWLLAAARSVLGELAEATHSSPRGPGLLEISAPGISKATTLARVCAERGVVAGDVLAFGDMPNDLPMLAWAGTAYAMTGGHPDVLAATPRHAPPVEADGVAQVLEPLFRPAAAVTRDREEGTGAGDGVG